MTAAADCHLLFGLLALQNGLIDQSRLSPPSRPGPATSRRAWPTNLEARGDLTVQARPSRHSRRSTSKPMGATSSKAWAAVPANRSTRASLADLWSPRSRRHSPGSNWPKNGRATEINADDHNDPDRTAGLSLGAATSDGERFRILRPHARGGLGEVFVALDVELHREVALKQILDRHADDPTSRQRFLLEAEITGGLEHPGIVPVYGLGTYEGGRPYYAMRFIRGDSLKEAIDHFHADESLNRDPGRGRWNCASCSGDSSMSATQSTTPISRGVLHRDIKPANIIVGKHGETLVVDWGLAKVDGSVRPFRRRATLMPSSASGSSETLPGSALGTPAYMSPEQANGDLDRLGPLSDVYSLGASLYCLLTGKPPFEADDVGELLRRVQRGQFPSPRQPDASIDRALEGVCPKAMAHRPGSLLVAQGAGRRRRAPGWRMSQFRPGESRWRGGFGGGRAATGRQSRVSRC